MSTVVDHRIQMRDRCIIWGTWEIFFRHPLWSLQPSLLVLCLWQQFVTFFFSGFHILCRLSSIFSFSFSFLLVICFTCFSPYWFLQYVQFNILLSPSIWVSMKPSLERGRVRGSNWLPEEWAWKSIFLEHMLDHLLECF